MRKGPIPQANVPPPSVCFPPQPKATRQPCACKDNQPKHEPYAVHIEEMDREQARGQAA